MAQRVLKAGGDLRPLGRKWMEGFLRRNPALQTLKARKISSKRIKCGDDGRGLAEKSVA
ncbi:hypothetical protein LY78DRAFT_659941 [Colletotrichum sublineola]|nr:hypothetical protein LY78DRAFT_659941 [Colletotrichum sublineola]